MKFPFPYLPLVGLSLLSCFFISCDGSSLSDAFDRDDSAGVSEITVENNDPDKLLLLPFNGLPNARLSSQANAFGSFVKEIVEDFRSGFNLILVSPPAGDSYDQYRLPVDLEGGIHTISFNYVGANMLSSTQGLTILHDTPTVRNLYLTTENFSFYVPLGGNNTVATEVAYTDYQHYEIVEVFDLDNETARITVNGQVIFDGEFRADTIENIRFSLGRIGNSFEGDIRAEISDFRITSEYPNLF